MTKISRRNVLKAARSSPTNLTSWEMCILRFSYVASLE